MSNSKSYPTPENPHHITQHTGTHLTVTFIAIAVVYVLHLLLTKVILAHVTVMDMANFLKGNFQYFELSLGLILLMLWNYIKRASLNAKVADVSRTSGMFYYSPNYSYAQVTESENFLALKGEITSHVRILGATGWRTFGRADSPLHQVLNACDQAEIILLNPFSPNLEKRASELNQAPQEYTNEICWSTQYIDRLSNEGDNKTRVSLKFYEGYPHWKYIFLGRYVWIQQYAPNINVRNTPCYAFKRISKLGVFKNLINNFLRYWNSNRLGVYNFRTKAIEWFDENGLKTKTLQYDPYQLATQPMPKSEVSKQVAEAHCIPPYSCLRKNFPSFSKCYDFVTVIKKNLAIKG